MTKKKAAAEKAAAKLARTATRPVKVARADGAEKLPRQVAPETSELYRQFCADLKYIQQNTARSIPMFAEWLGIAPHQYDRIHLGYAFGTPLVIKVTEKLADNKGESFESGGSHAACYKKMGELAADMRQKNAAKEAGLEAYYRQEDHGGSGAATESGWRRRVSEALLRIIEEENRDINRLREPEGKGFIHSLDAQAVFYDSVFTLALLKRVTNALGLTRDTWEETIDGIFTKAAACKAAVSQQAFSTIGLMVMDKGWLKELGEGLRTLRGDNTPAAFVADLIRRGGKGHTDLDVRQYKTLEAGGVLPTPVVYDVLKVFDGDMQKAADIVRGAAGKGPAQAEAEEFDGDRIETATADERLDKIAGTSVPLWWKMGVTMLRELGYETVGEREYTALGTWRKDGCGQRT